MSQLLYNLFVRLFGTTLTIASLFSAKAKRWSVDRSHQNIEIDLPRSSKRVWFHVSSLGELEQAYPLISEFKNLDYYTILTCFSHSAYDYLNRYPDVDKGFLLPLDSPKNAQQLAQNIQADLVFWTKNDFWLNTINTIIKDKTPIILFAAKFYDGHFIGRIGFSIFKKTLNKFNHIFVQDEKSLNLLTGWNINNCTLGGDTRVDRVKQRALKSIEIPGLLKFKSSKELLILASVHEQDNDIIKEAVFSLREYYKILIVPHHIDIKSIRKIMRDIPDQMYQINDSLIETELDVVVFNKMGLLFDLYRDSDIVYIGGGFGKGIHNILEPTVFGNSVIFGPKYSKFWEAEMMLKKELSFTCNNQDEFMSIMLSLNSNQRSKIKSELVSFYSDYPNAVEKIMLYCKTQKYID